MNYANSLLVKKRMETTQDPGKGHIPGPAYNELDDDAPLEVSLARFFRIVDPLLESLEPPNESRHLFNHVSYAS